MIGTYNWNKQSTMIINNCTNNGDIKGTYSVGGLIGVVEENVGNVLVNCSSNTKKIDGSDFSSGLIGNVYSVHPDTSFVLTMENCANKGPFVGSNGLACGMFCVNQGKSRRVEVKLMNSINKGSVEGSNAYGISTIVDMANNIVNTGNVTGQSPCSLWNECKKPQYLYVEQSHFNPCSSEDIKKISFDVSQNVYKTEEDDIVHVNLNKESIKEKYGMGWTNDLEFSVLQLVIGNPVNVIVPVIPGDTLSNVFQNLNIVISDFIVVNKSDNEILQPSTTLQFNTEIALSHSIVYSGVKNGTTLIEHGDILENNKDLKPFLTKDYLLTNLNDSTIIYDQNTNVLEDMNILITAVKRTEIVIDFGNETETNNTTVRDAILDVIISNGDTPAQITVIWEDDGIYRILLVLPEEETETLTDHLLSCSSNNHN